MDHILIRSDMIVVGHSWSDRYSRRDPLVGIRHAFDLVMRRRGSSF
jgi:hypothetical protein